MAQTKGAATIGVLFKKGIRADGEIVRVTITQHDQEIRLTQDQAKSLASQIYSKFGWPE